MEFGLRRSMIVIFFLVYAISAAAEDVKRVILMETMPVPSVLEHSEWFQVQLRELGYENGKNMDLVILKANGDRQLAESLLSAELSRKDPDLVATIATLASQAAARLLTGKKVPLLFFQVSDPVGAGLVERINAPTGTNITGRVFTVNTKAKIKILLRLAGQTKTRPRFGIIHSTYPSSMGDLRELKQVDAANADMELVPHEIPYKKVPEGLPFMLDETRKGIRALAGRVDFWIEPLGALGETPEYTRLLMEASDIPIAMGTNIESVKMGALMHVTPNMEASGREAALVADDILKGKDPGLIPVIPPADFELGINLTTALKLKIVIPPDLLQMAGENVCR